MTGPRPGAEFDRYAADYDTALARGIAVSGENKDFFAQGRVEWLARRLRSLGAGAGSILDFGCGTGSATPYLLGLSGGASLLGVDVSIDSIDVAGRDFGSARARFLALEGFVPDGTMDLAYCNGVFHHIPRPERAAAVDLVFRSLRPGGLFAFWENNPWNPGTHYVMSRIPFDRDAVLLWPGEARRLLRAGGFEVVGTDFTFVFPRALALLRGLEPVLAPLPLGAQYLVLCRRP